jgi:putative transposase
LKSFLPTLECQVLDRYSLPTPAGAKTRLFKWLEGWYNPHRRHSALGQLSPPESEHRHATQERRPPEMTHLEADALRVSVGLWARETVVLLPEGRDPSR